MSSSSLSVAHYYVGSWHLCSVCFGFAPCRGCPCGAGYRYCSRGCQRTHWVNEHRDFCPTKTVSETLRASGFDDRVIAIIRDFCFPSGAARNIVDVVVPNDSVARPSDQP